MCERPIRHGKLPTTRTVCNTGKTNLRLYLRQQLTTCIYPATVFLSLSFLDIFFINCACLMDQSLSSTATVASEQWHPVWTIDDTQFSITLRVSWNRVVDGTQQLMGVVARPVSSENIERINWIYLALPGVQHADTKASTRDSVMRHWGPFSQEPACPPANPTHPKLESDRKHRLVSRRTVII